MKTNRTMKLISKPRMKERRKKKYRNKERGGQKE
jgi:hypothetical protein